MPIHEVDGRLFLEIPMDYGYAEEGWSAFEYIRRACLFNLVHPNDLEWAYAEENYGAMVAVFEVKHHV